MAGDSSIDPSTEPSGSVPGDTPPALTAPVVDPARLVTLFYRCLLKRAPEEGAVESWVRGMEGGLAPEEVLERFLGSEEFLRRHQDSGLFVPPGHFYSPIVDTASVAHLFNGSPPVPMSLPGIDPHPDRQLALWHRFVPHLQRIPFPIEQTEGFRYHLDNPAYGVGDGSVYFAFLMEFRPKRIVEIGSGYSSACAVDTIEHFFDHAVEIDFIEPYPERLKTLLGQSAGRTYRIHEQEVQKADLTLFDRLEAGDILFIDSTHVLKTGSDVHFELFEVLPRLRKGVLVHVHDMFWPFEYPKGWVMDQNRSWNELYAVRAFLMYQEQFEIVFFNDFFRQACHDVVEATYPAFLRKRSGALWLRKT
jgi:hypothetical protein